MDIVQILELVATLEPALLSFVQAIVKAINGAPALNVATEDKAVPTMTPEQKAMLTSLLATHRDMHIMLCDAMNKNYGITV